MFTRRFILTYYQKSILLLDFSIIIVMVKRNAKPKTIQTITIPPSITNELSSIVGSIKPAQTSHLLIPYFYQMSFSNLATREYLKNNFIKKYERKPKIYSLSQSNKWNTIRLTSDSKSLLNLLLGFSFVETKVFW